MGVGKFAPVRDVETPVHDFRARGSFDSDAERASFLDCGIAPRRHSWEANLHVKDGESGGNRDPVPLVQAVQRHLVAQCLKGQQRELVIPALGFLQGQNVNVRPLQERSGSVDAGPNGVDVPGCDPHTPTITGWRGDLG